jgi:hypothetical protein
MEIDDSFMLADTPLMLEHGVVKGVISYPEYYEIMSVVKVAEKRNLLPKFTDTHDHYRLAGVVEKKYDYYHDSTAL